ncbi:hypothetical protein M758_5G037500 [Ceratodon purpureus]|nr:hypothetical protein M758_5G037500 [Ceratodon purpureus]
MEQSHGSTATQAIPTWSSPGGEGEGSYSGLYSKMWKQMGSIIQPSLKHAILHQFSPPKSGTEPIHYADFGYAVRNNTLGFAKFVVDALKMRPDVIDRDIVCHFADLPSFDFNKLFKQLPPFTGQGDGSVEERTWFADGVPGTQYGRMFPRSSLHVAITTLTLHYLSELPKSILDKSSPAYNKGKVGCHGSSPATAEAYAKVSRQGLRKFFECRAEEIASGGVLGFYCLGRRDRAHPENQLVDEGSNYLLDIEKTWKELVNEGVLTDESLDDFNLPLCYPSIDELQEAIEHPPSAFRIEKLDFIEKRPLADKPMEFDDAEAYGKFMTVMFGNMRPRLARYGLAPELTDEFEKRYRQNCEKSYAAKKAAGFPMNMSMCVAVLVRK